MTAGSYKIQIITFYKFYPITEQQLPVTEAAIYALRTYIDQISGHELALRGLCILGVEGINATFSIESEFADLFKNEVLKIMGTNEVVFKESSSDKHVFHNFKIKIRKEIVTLSRPDLVPHKTHHHLSPKNWHEAMKSSDVAVVDTRNSFEYDVGHFKGAIDPKINEFNEFPEWVRHSNIPKEKKILIYCTGGIRCEKAILEMEEQGYQNVYQLEGGILNYLKEYPTGLWDGECFVFDYRVAVDANLQATTQYKLCPHCGQPGKTSLACIQCGITEIVCDTCISKADEFKTCSKNCAHHFRLGHKNRRIHKDALRKRNSL